MRDTEGKIYIGNCKKAEAKQPEPISNNDLEDLEEPPF